MTARTLRRSGIYALLVAVAAGGGWSPLAAQPRPVLTLAQAVQEALAKNDRLVNERDTIEQADLGVRLARNVFQPKVTPNILGSFGQTDIASQTYRVDVSQRLTTGTELRFSIGTATAQIPPQPGAVGDVRFYNADTTLTLSQPLLRGFGRNVSRRMLSAAEARRADAERVHVLAEQQVAVDVAAAYYRLVAQQAFVDVARQSVERARKLQAASAAKLEVGLVSQLDVLRAQQLVTQSEHQLADAESAIDDARDYLAFLIARPASEPFDVDRVIPPPDGSTIDVDAAAAAALRNRLDLKSRVEESAEARRQVAFTRNQLLPQVDLNLALTRRETSDSFANSFALDGYQFATFFTIAMPVDRTPQQIDYQNALLDRDRRVREIETLERQIVDDVRRAVRERDRIARTMSAAETSVRLGRQEVEVAQFRYENGLSNNLDVVAAESNLLAAEGRRVQALAEAAIAALRLRAMIGVLDPRADIGAPTAPGGGGF